MSSDTSSEENMEEIWGTERTHECGTCRTKFFSAVHLKEHEDEHRYLKEWIPCSYCGTKFFDRFSLKQHFIFHREEEESKCCNICGIGVKIVGSISDHYKTTHKPSPTIIPTEPRSIMAMASSLQRYNKFHEDLLKECPFL